MNPNNPNFRTSDEWFDVCGRLNKKNSILQSKLDIGITALKYIEQHRWASNTGEPHKWINEFCEVSRIALEKINKLKGER